jgi:hypothetical protein
MKLVAMLEGLRGPTICTLQENYTAINLLYAQEFTQNINSYIAINSNHRFIITFKNLSSLLQ